MYRLKKILISLFFILCSAFIFAELPKAPNILITDNPSKEVTTVNALKNRDHAELNITVNKVNIKKLNGIELPNGEVLITLPETQDAKIDLKENEIFYVTDSLDNFPNLATINGKREIYNLKELEESIASDKVDIVEYENYSLIKNIKKNTELYLGIIDKSNGNINKIWKIDKNKNYKTEEIKGYIENDNLIINLSNLDNLKTNILQKKVIFLGTNNEKKEELQPRSRRKRSLSEKEKIEVTYTPNEKSKLFGTISDNLKINLNSNTPNNIIAFDKASNKLYTFSGRKIGEILGDAQIKYRINEMALFKQYNNGFYLDLGVFTRFNVRKSETHTDDGTVFNFSIPDSQKEKKIQFRLFNTSNSSISKIVELTINMENPNIVIAGSNNKWARESHMRSEYYDTQDHLNNYGPLPDFSKYGITPPPMHQEYGRFAAFILGFKLLYQVDEAIYREILSGKYDKITNTTPLDFTIRHWVYNDPQQIQHDKFKNHVLLAANSMTTDIVFSEQETIDLSNCFVGEAIYSKKLNTNIYFDENFTLNDRLVTSITPDNPLEIINGVALYYNSADKKIYFKKIDKVSSSGSKNIVFKKGGKKKYDITFKIINTYRNPVESNIKLNSPVYHKFAIGEPNILSRSENIGKDYNIGSASGNFWQIADFNITNRLKFFGDTKSIGEENLDQYWRGHIYEKDGLKVRMTFNQDKKAHFEILYWDGKKNNLKIGYESVYQKQTINLQLPDFNGLSYLKDTNNPEINYATKTVIKSIKNYDNGNLGSFNVQLDDYNIKEFGNHDLLPNSKPDSNYIQQPLFVVQLPKNIKLTLPDHSEIPVMLNVVDLNKDLNILESSSGKIYLYPTKNTSKMNFLISLSANPNYINKSKNLERYSSENLKLIGKNLDLVKIGLTNSSKDIYSTAIDNIEINIEKTTYTESFDVSSLDNQTTVTGDNEIPISESSQLEIYEIGQQQNTLLTKISMKDFINSGYNLSETNSLLKYDLQTKKFQLTKLKGKDISKNYQIKVNSFGIVSKIINIAVKNGAFGIIEGKNILNFGDFFPGDVKVAETYIKFKNFTGNNISIKMKKDTEEMTLNGNTTSDPNEKIKLSEFRVSDLDTQNPQENKFKIRGVATTTKSTKVGKYKGRAEVIITIIP